MYDQATHSLWNQFTGRPVVGPLTGSGIELAVLPVTIARWQDWLAAHPETKVLSLATGHQRDYTPGQPYGDYFASAELMFPVLVQDERLAPKDYVFAPAGRGRAARPGRSPPSPAAGCSTSGSAEVPVVLVGDAASRTVRAYRSDGRSFAAGAEARDAAGGRRALADRGERAGRAAGRASGAAAGPHRLLVRLAGVHRGRAARPAGQVLSCAGAGGRCLPRRQPAQAMGRPRTCRESRARKKEPRHTWRGPASGIAQEGKPVRLEHDRSAWEASDDGHVHPFQRRKSRASSAAAQIFMRRRESRRR